MQDLGLPSVCIYIVLIGKGLLKYEYVDDKIWEKLGIKIIELNSLMSSAAKM